MCRLGLNERSVILLTYTVLVAILLYFTGASFEVAALTTGGALLVPIFEEIFFRSFLLGSLVGDWPNIEELPRPERLRLFKKSILPLLVTSVLFSLVHDDAITALMGLPFLDLNMIVIMVLRMLFSMAVGGLYLLRGKLILPVIFHVSFNLSYFLMTS